MLLGLLDKALSAKFFDILRTQQQLGYIVHMSPSVSLKMPALAVLVQTEFNPDYVRGPFDQRSILSLACDCRWVFFFATLPQDASSNSWRSTCSSLRIPLARRSFLFAKPDIFLSCV